MTPNKACVKIVIIKYKHRLNIDQRYDKDMTKISSYIFD